MSKLDLIYDVLIYTLIALCFTGSGVLIIRQVINVEANHLYQIGSLIGFGLVLSMFVFYLKSWGSK